LDVLRELFENAWKYVTMASLVDIADIVIVAFLLYQLFRLLQNSSAMGILRGVILLLVIVGLSQLLRLQVLSFILQSTFQVGLLAIVILFQPELRRILEQVGATNIPGFFVRQANSNVESSIMQTVEACRSLAWAHEGSLIVYERLVSLSDIIKTGTIVDSAVTSELIKNIFFPKAPLHDGAIIIREGRISAAGCVLPLTGNPNLSKDLGMRHRAGIGMSEKSDAVVIIISEENGSVSVATDGMLKRHLAPETLEKILRASLLPPEDDDNTGSLKRFFKKFFGGKKADDRR
jgi:diadenylate cyclase